MHNKSVAAGTDTGMLCALRRPLIAALFGAFALASFTGTAPLTPVRADTPEDVSRAVANTSAEDIVAAKTNVADLYAGYLAGSNSESEVRRAEAVLSVMTGEAIPAVSAGGKARLASDYAPIRQVTDYYCGPATVQSILWFLGVRDEAAVNAPATAEGMTGRGDVDQPLLASGSQLGTEYGQGTDWGNVVPDTINNWRGTRWYQAFGTANAGGTLHKDQAWRDIVYAVDHGYPLAANVTLSSNTVLPTGFDPGMDYQHWETIVGYFVQNGVKYVKVGQVYGAENLEYDPLQEIAWDTYWPAIGNHYGIVW